MASTSTLLNQAILDYPRAFGWETSTDHSSLHEDEVAHYNYKWGNFLKGASYFPLLGIITAIYRLYSVYTSPYATNSDKAWHTFRAILECLPVISTALLIVDAAMLILRGKKLEKEDQSCFN